MKQYLETLRYVYENGVVKRDRTGTGTVSALGLLERYDLTDNKVPVVTTRKIPLMLAVREGLWYISGQTRLKGLIDLGVTFWNKWVKPGTEVWKELTLADRLDLVHKMESTHLSEFETKFGKDVFLDVFANWSIFAENDTGRKVTLTDLLDWLEMRGVPHKVLVDGELGEVYGHQWRFWDRYELVPDGGECVAQGKALEARGFKCILDEGRDENGVAFNVYHRNHDQLADLIETLRNNPSSRRHIISAWNPGFLDSMALPPCHYNIQFDVTDMTLVDMATRIENAGLLGDLTEYMAERYDFTGEDENKIAYNWRSAFSTNAPLINVVEDLQAFCAVKGLPCRYLSSMLSLRSSDIPVGRPYNILWYSVMTHMVAQCVGMEAKEFVIVSADTHIYLDQLEFVEEQLKREPKPQTTKLWLNPNVKDITAFTPDDFKFEGYESHPHIPYPVAV